MEKDDRPPLKPFWDFSVEIYAKPGVEQACLALQDQGLSINMALWVVWTCLYGRDPGPALGQALDHNALWGSRVILPLRNARMAMKPAPDFIDPQAAVNLREAVQSAELEAERLEQLALEALSRACPETKTEEIETLAYARLQDYATRVGLNVSLAKFVEVIFASIKMV